MGGRSWRSALSRAINAGLDLLRCQTIDLRVANGGSDIGYVVLGEDVNRALANWLTTFALASQALVFEPEREDLFDGHLVLGFTTLPLGLLDGVIRFPLLGGLLHRLML